MKLFKISPTKYIDFHKVDSIDMFNNEVIFKIDNKEHAAKKTDKLIKYLNEISYDFTGGSND